MAKKQRPGFMLYHEDIDDLGMLEAEDFKRLFLALAKYSQTGETETLGGGLDVLYRLMLRKIAKQDEAYEAACQQRQKAAESRWGARNADASACETTRKDTGACGSMREDAEACETMREDASACETMREDAEVCESMREDASACETMRDDAKHANRNLNLNLNLNLSPQNIEKQSVTRAREDAETEADDKIRDRCVRKLKEAGEKGDPFLEDGIAMLIGRHGSAKVERAVDRAVSDRSPNIQDVRNILLSWERTDEARDAFDGFCRDDGGDMDDDADREVKKA